MAPPELLDRAAGLVEAGLWDESSGIANNEVDGVKVRSRGQGQGHWICRWGRVSVSALIPQCWRCSPGSSRRTQSDSALNATPVLPPLDTGAA